MDWPPEPEELRRLYWDEGLSTGQIASVFGVSAATIRRVMGLQGIVTRRPGRPPLRADVRLVGIATVLPRVQRDALFRLADASGRTVSDLVREGLALLLQEERSCPVTTNGVSEGSSPPP